MARWQVIREVAVLDVINRGGDYARRVRRLGDFHTARRCAACVKWRRKSCLHLRHESCLE